MGGASSFPKSKSENRDCDQGFGNKREPLKWVIKWGGGQVLGTPFGRSDASFSRKPSSKSENRDCDQGFGNKREPL